MQEFIDFAVERILEAYLITGLEPVFGGNGDGVLTGCALSALGRAEGNRLAGQGPTYGGQCALRGAYKLWRLAAEWGMPQETTYWMAAGLIHGFDQTAENDASPMGHWSTGWEIGRRVRTALWGSPKEEEAEIQA